MSSPLSPTPDPALRLAERFHILGHAFKRWMQTLIDDAGGVSPARLRLLGVLHCRGPQIMSGLSDELGVTARNVTTLVDALESEGKVRRTPHPTDRRATVVELTAQGMASASELVDSFTEKTAGLFRDLSEADQRELLRLVEALLAALQKRGQAGRGCG
jgi:DNA-binding MarR family transcriptional regulator